MPLRAGLRKIWMYLGMDYAFVGGEIAVSALSNACAVLQHIASDFFADKDYFQANLYQMLSVCGGKRKMPLSWAGYGNRSLKTAAWHEEAVDLPHRQRRKQTASEAWLKHWVWKWRT